MSLLAATLFMLALPFSQASAAGDVIYTTTGPGTGFATVDSTTAASTFLGPTGYTNTFAAALDLDGTLWTIVNGFSTAQIATVDKTTGAATPAPNPIGTPMIMLEIGGDGTMYGLGYNDGVLYRMNKATGIGTAIGDTGIVTPMDLAFDCDGRLWATAAGDVWTVDTTTGVATAQPSITGTSEGAAMVMGMFFDSSCQMLVTTYTNPGTLYAVDASGAATAIGSTGLNQPHGGSIKAFASKTVAPATDTQAPSTTDNVPVSWQVAKVAVTLTAIDNPATGSSGVARVNGRDAIYYETGADPAAPTTASRQYDPASKPVLANGQKIRYFAIDAAGNVEASKTSNAAKVLTSRRRETIHFNTRYRGHRVRAINAKVGGHKLKVKRSRGRYKILVDLRGRACAPVKVRIKVVLRGARAVSLKRVFRTCVPRAGS